MKLQLNSYNCKYRTSNRSVSSTTKRGPLPRPAAMYSSKTAYKGAPMCGGKEGFNAVGEKYVDPGKSVQDDRYKGKQMMTAPPRKNQQFGKFESLFVGEPYGRQQKTCVDSRHVASASPLPRPRTRPRTPNRSPRGPLAGKHGSRASASAPRTPRTATSSPTHSTCCATKRSWRCVAYHTFEPAFRFSRCCLPACTPAPLHPCTRAHTSARR